MSPSRERRGRRRWCGPERSPRPSWCGMYLDRIERLDPAAQLLPQGLRRAGAARGRAGRGAAEGGRGAAAARRADRDQGRSRRRRRDEHARHRRLPRAGDAPTAEMVRRLREAGAIIVGMTLLPELAICGFTESATCGSHPQPLEPAAQPRRLQRRQRRRGGGRAGPDRLGFRRRRLDPHPRRLLRPLRAETAARPGLAGARARTAGTGSRSHGCVSRTVLDTALWLDIVSGGSAEPEAPPPPERPFVESARTPPGRLRVAWSTARTARRRAADRLRRRQGRRRRDGGVAALARATRSSSATPTGAAIGNNITPRYLRGVAEDCREGPPAGAARTAHPRLRHGSAA